MLPNSIVVAFDSRVRFEACEQDKSDSTYARVGTLSIPIDPTGSGDDKPGVIVDGRQRVAAIREAAVTSFPVVVTAFVSSNIREKSEQFILINSTKPLPKELVYELLPGTTATLPKALQRRRFPAYLLELLNHEEDSPFRGMIRTATTPHGLVKDSVVLTMLENSLSDGVLYRYRYTENGVGDVDNMLAVLSNFWRAVRQVFVEAWALPIRSSRLMHSAGIISLGFLMDSIADRLRHTQVPTQEQFADDLKPLVSVCRWTDGYWDFGLGMQRKWNEIQNTPKDIQLLTNYLLVQYKSLVFNRAF
jgi:DGQHR domain-containing protein